MKLTSVALPPQHLPFQQEQFVRVRKQFKTSINDSQQRARGERSDGRTRKRDEVVGEEEEEEEEDEESPIEKDGEVTSHSDKTLKYCGAFVLRLFSNKQVFEDLDCRSDATRDPGAAGAPPTITVQEPEKVCDCKYCAVCWLFNNSKYNVYF